MLSSLYCSQLRIQLVHVSYNGGGLREYVNFLDVHCTVLVVHLTHSNNSSSYFTSTCVSFLEPIPGELYG